jgi:glutathione S-transferase
MGDSQLIIEFLIKQFDKDLSAHLTQIEKSTARAYLKLNEESTRWAGVVHRFKYGKPEDCGILPPFFELTGKSMLKDAYGQGYAKHSKEELHDIGLKDMEAFEIFMADGKKKFLMADKPCNEDASMFALLAQVVNHDRGPFNKYMKAECPNLMRYYETMKSTYWPDWDQNIREKKNQDQ